MLESYHWSLFSHYPPQIVQNIVTGLFLFKGLKINHFFRGCNRINVGPRRREAF